MNSNHNSRKAAALLLAAFMVLVAMAPAPAVQAGSPNPGLAPPQAHPYGHTYGEWLDGWAQWAFSIPAETNPLLDETGEFCALGQSGPVWFLAPNFGGTTTRSCTVPTGKALAFSIMGTACSPAFGDPSNEEALRQCAREQIDMVTQVEVIVDGVPLVGLLDNYRFQTPYTTLTFIENNVFGVPPQTAPYIADGHIVVLTPLPVGEHTVRMMGSALWGGGFSEDITYHLTVAP